MFYRRHTCRKGLSKQTSLVIGRRRFAYLLQMVLISDKSQTDLGNLQTVTQAENKGYSSLRSRKKHSAGSKSKLNHGKSHIRLTVILLIISCSYGGLSRAKWLPVHTSSLFSLLMIHRLKTCKQPAFLSQNSRVTSTKIYVDSSSSIAWSTDTCYGRRTMSKSQPFFLTCSSSGGGSVWLSMLVVSIHLRAECRVAARSDAKTDSTSSDCLCRY